jgi:hypothetical protein
MGWLVVGFLTAFALFDAAALALATRPRGRAELGIATGLSFAALIGFPILGLGYANVLWHATLAPVCFVLYAAIFLVLARREGGTARFAALVRRALGELASLPIAALREAWRARSMVFLGLLAAGALIGASLVLTYLIEFCRWDDEIYHVPTVGWGIQHHGFGFVDGTAKGVGGTNGYPKFAEALSLWFVIFTDRTLIELPATLFAPPVMLAVYGLTRRFVDRVCAMGFAVVLLLVPHTWRQFCSSYNDMEMAFFLLAATYYVSREEQRGGDLVMATLAMAMAAATKTTWLVFVPPLAIVAYARRLAAPSASRQRALGAIVASMTAIAAAGAFCVARNWWHYGNPVWPITYDFPRLGIHLPGILTTEDYRGHDPAVTEGFDVPHGGMHDVMRHGYGLAVMWVAGPFAVVAIVVWLLSLGRDAVLGTISDASAGIAPVILPCLAWLATGPNFGQPRYNLHVIGAFLALVAWLVRGARRVRAREGLLGGMLALSLVPLFWIGDANVTTVAEEQEHLAHPFAHHAFSDHPSFDLLERVKYEDLKPGDEVIFSQGVAFTGLLWNFEFSNHVDYVEFTGDDFAAKLEQRNTKWVCVGGNTAARKALEQTGQYTLIGRTNPALDEVVFRRNGAS